MSEDQHKHNKKYRKEPSGNYKKKAKGMNKSRIKRNPQRSSVTWRKENQDKIYLKAAII